MNKNKLILSFYIGTITLSVATLSMSVAWYAMSSKLKVEGIVMTIDSDRDLKISTSRDGEYVDGYDYQDDEINKVEVFMPVTTAHSGNWMDLKSDMPVFYDETKYSTIEDTTLYTIANQGFFSQKFYLQSDDDIYVTIDPVKSFLGPNVTFNHNHATNLFYQDYDPLQHLTDEEIEERIAAIETKINKLVNAMRFSILLPDENDYHYYIIDPNKNDDTSLGGLLDNDMDLYYDYFYNAQGDACERVYGELVGDEHIVYDNELPSDSDYEDTNEEPSAFNAKHKAGVKQFNLEKSKEAGLEIKTEEKIDLKDFNNQVKPFHFPVYRNTPKEVVVSIYIEGWDLDSVNYTMGVGFESNLSFLVEREM